MREIIKSLKNDIHCPLHLQRKQECPIPVVENFIGSLLSTIAGTMTGLVDDNVVIQVEEEIKLYLINLDISYE